MDDILTRAWNLLEPGERPVGMGRVVIPHTAPIRYKYCDEAHRPSNLSDRAARDRLIVAVEDVLIRNLWGWGYGGKGYNWFHLEGEDDIVHPDRLTAAVLALEAERNSNDK